MAPMSASSSPPPTTRTSTAPTSHQWSALENLLLAQAVFKFGDDNWNAVARTIRSHSLLTSPPEHFAPKACATQFQNLYSQVADYNPDDPYNKITKGEGSEMPPLVKLCRQLYFKRIEELKRLIQEDEVKFRSLLIEIDDIKNGKWDHKFETALKARKDASPKKPAVSQGDFTEVEDSNVETPSQASDNRDTAMDVDSTQGVSRPAEPENNLKHPRSVPSHPVIHPPSSPAAKSPERPTTRARQRTPSLSPPTATTKGSPVSQRRKTRSRTTSSTSSPKVSASLHPPQPTSKTRSNSESRSPSPRRTRASSQSSPLIRQPSLPPHPEVTTTESDREETERMYIDNMNMEPLPETKSEMESEAETEDFISTRRRSSSAVMGSEGFMKKDKRKMKATETDMDADDTVKPEPMDYTGSPGHLIRRHSDSDSVANSMDTYESGTESTDSVFPTSSAVKKKPTVANKSWRKLIYHEWDLISNHRLGLTFMSKLKKDSYPGFYDAVKEVLDLKGIKSRVRDGTVTTTDEFHRDLLHLVSNHIMFFHPDEDRHLDAQEFRQAIDEEMKRFKTTEMMAARRSVSVPPLSSSASSSHPNASSAAPPAPPSRVATTPPIPSPSSTAHSQHKPAGVASALAKSKSVIPKNVLDDGEISELSELENGQNSGSTSDDELEVDVEGDGSTESVRSGVGRNKRRKV